MKKPGQRTTLVKKAITTVKDLAVIDDVDEEDQSSLTESTPDSFDLSVKSMRSDDHKCHHKGKERKNSEIDCHEVHDDLSTTSHDHHLVSI